MVPKLKVISFPCGLIFSGGIVGKGSIIIKRGLGLRRGKKIILKLTSPSAACHADKRHGVIDDPRLGQPLWPTDRRQLCCYPQRKMRQFPPLHPLQSIYRGRNVGELPGPF